MPLPDSGPSFPAYQSFDLQGHRGARGLAPENTLLGFERASFLGVTTLEMDAAITADRIVVVTHDRRLNPEITRNPQGDWLSPPTPTIYSLLYAELQTFDVGRINPASAYSRRFPAQTGADGIRIPRLASVFEAFRETGLRFNIETKLSPLAPEETPSPVEFADLIYEAICTADMKERCTVQSFDWRTLLRLKDNDPGLRLSFLTSRETVFQGGDLFPWAGGIRMTCDSIVRLVSQVSRDSYAPTWSPEFESITEVDVQEARDLGLKVIPWTLNRPTDMQKAIDWGVAGFITDFPDIASGIVQSNGLALASQLPLTARPMGRP